MEKNSIELKAREIYEKMLYEIEDVEAERPGNDVFESTATDSFSCRSVAKQCAIILCDEVLNEIPDTLLGITNDGVTMEMDNHRKLYWQQVKEAVGKII